MSGDVPVAGEVLAGKYVVERVLGQGGMGIVLAARHRELDARVAVKLLRTRPAPSVEAVERFQREARAAARLKSDHVARVSDVGVLPDGTPFMVMEHLEGADLAEILRGGPLAPGLVADLVAQACEAVAEAHAAGIVHRDLKPSNLFLTRTVRGGARVKVLDFGISKLRTTGGAEPLAETAQGTMLGTPLYMSPEQMRSSRDVDARSDVWSLGLVAFELLTGSVPWSTESIAALALDVTTTPAPDPRELRPEVPRGLADVVLRCLAKDPAGRFTDASELGAALAAHRTETGPAATDALLGRVPASRGAIESAATTPAAPSPGAARASPLGSTGPISGPAPVTPAATPASSPAPSALPAIGGTLVVVAIAIGSMFAARYAWDDAGPPAAPAPAHAPEPDAGPPPPDAFVPPEHPRPCVEPPDPPCAAEARAWCLPEGTRVACCDAGLVPTSDGFCECPPGGALDAATIASGCAPGPDTPVRERLQAVMVAHMPAMRACYEARLAERATLTGEITLAFTVSPWGELWDARIDASSLPDPDAQRCLLGELRAMRLDPPLPGGWPVQVSYPLIFETEE